jgi:hypothetical protein
MTRSLRLLMFIGVAAAAVLPAGSALARPTRVALCRITGDTTGLDKAVSGALEEGELEVVAGKQVARAMDRLGLASPLGDRELAKLADELEVDAVVKGAFDRRGHRLKFTIFAGGKQGKPFTLTVGNADSDKFRQLVRSTVEGKLAQAVQKRRSHESDEVADDDPPAKRSKARMGEKAEKADEAADDDPPAKHKAKKGEKAEKAEVADEDPPAKRKAKKADKADKADAVAEDDPPAKRKARKGDKAEKAEKTDEVADDPPAKRKARKGDKADKADDVAAAAEPAKPRPKAAEADAAAPEAKPAAKDDDAPAPAGPRVATRDDDDPTPSVHARAELAGPATEHTANLAALRAEIGGSMAGRKLTFRTRSFAAAPKSYSNMPVLGARAAGELYPGALFAPHSWLAGFGVAGDYDRTMSLTLRASNETSVPLAIAEQHYEFGVRYRLAFGHTTTSPTLTVGVGYSARRFAVDRSHLQSTSSLDLPDVDYRMFDPGLAFRMPLGNHVAVTLGGDTVLVTSIGPMQHADQYGATHVIGGDASLGVEVLVTQRVLIRLAAEATQMSLSFVGKGMLATTLDGNPSTVDVRGATDRYYGGVATAVVTY